MNEQDLAKAIVGFMLRNDPFSQWLGIQVLEVQPGYCRLSMQVKTCMLNGFNKAHGGISYSLADSCLAFAANAFGIQCMSIETSISHLRPVADAEVLLAESTLLDKSTRLARYAVTVSRQADGKPVAQFKGTVFYSGEPWINLLAEQK
jgi:acyl-CoA thioesterase